jgi:hypothetical protein
MLNPNRLEVVQPTRFQKFHFTTWSTWEFHENELLTGVRGAYAHEPFFFFLGNIHNQIRTLRLLLSYLLEINFEARREQDPAASQTECKSQQKTMYTGAEKLILIIKRKAIVWVVHQGWRVQSKKVSEWNYCHNFSFLCWSLSHARFMSYSNDSNKLIGKQAKWRVGGNQTRIRKTHGYFKSETMRVFYFPPWSWITWSRLSGRQKDDDKQVVNSGIVLFSDCFYW